MLRNMLALLLGIISLAALPGCDRETGEARSMEQIYREEGVPVKTVTIQPRLFESELDYHAVLSGIEESSAYASIGDRIEKVLVNIGDYVERDQVLITFPTDNPSAQYYQAKIAYDNAKAAYERVENLYKAGGISLQNYDNTKAQYEVAKANYDAVSQMVKVRAPMSGYVTKINVVESENVDRDAELVTVSRTNRLKAKIWVAEKEIKEIRAGLPALAVWQEKTLRGQVIQVDLSINQMSQAFGAVLEFENEDNGLLCGVTADITVKTYQNPEAIVTEIKNILQDDQGAYVYVAADGMAEKRVVRTGRRHNLLVEITDGVQSGDALIVQGQMLLEPGSKVKIIE